MSDAAFMREALELAGSGWGRVHPNPMVGAVVVRDGEVVGRGAHEEYGGPHAEVVALAAAGERARGATLYVTLEPCAHHGKTPPCTAAIREAGVARVVYAVADPHPEAGGGGERLASAGIDVRSGVEAEAARRQNAPFLTPIETGRPFVALKLATSIDARIAARAGERTRLTGPEAEAAVHRLRSGFDAVMVGGRTARIDDPLLTVRAAPAPRVPPTRVVVSVTARLAPESRLLTSAEEAPVVVVTGPAAPSGHVAALERAGASVVRTEAAGGGIDMVAALDALYERGIRTVLCEGGGRLGSALLRADRVDRLYLFQAPVVLGEEGVPAFPGAPVFRGRRIELGPVGEDALVVVDRSG